MRRIILDTDVASLVIKQRLPATLTRQLLAAESGITFVTYGELTRWSIMRQWGTTRRSALDALAGGAPHAPLHRRRRTDLGRDLRPRHPSRRPRPQNDTSIAAAYLAYALPFATLNVKDFSDFAEHEGLVLV